MVLLLLLALITFIVAIKSGYVYLKWSILFFGLMLFLFALWLFEYSTLGNIEFFVSDEVNYFEGGTSFKWLDFLEDRGLWYFINYWLLQVDIPTGGYALKLINIFFLYFLLVLLSSIFSDQRILLGTILFLPYTMMSALYNLRDTLILLVLVSSVFCLTTKRQLLLPGVLSLILLFFLRPIFAGLAVLIIVTVLFLQFIKGLIKFKISLKRFAILTMILLIILPTAITKLDKAMYVFTVYVETGGARLERVEAQGYATGNRPRDFIVAAARYGLAPLPTSLFVRTTIGGSDDWGILNDIVRMLNQFGYYILLIYAILKWKTIITVLKKMTASQIAVLMSLFMYLPIYSVHLYGACHQRLKLPFQLLVLILVALAWKMNKQIKRNRAVSTRAYGYVAHSIYP
jgi:hypothetical protein